MVLLGAIAACRPDLGPADSLVTAPRILAIQGEPPEVKPGAPASYTALVASAGRSVAGAPILWRWCLAPKPVVENGAVSTGCLEASSLAAAGTGPAVSAVTPANACALFGPDTPPGGLRPHDPDSTGGYYQPLRADLGASTTFDLARVLCNLASAPADVATQYARDYAPNANPHLLPLVATVGGAAASFDAVSPGASVHLEAGWLAADAETYAYFDPAAQSLVTRRESMRVAWYASAGVLDTESTGRAEDDPSTVTDNVWTAPTSGRADLWLVLRDGRGGVDFATYPIRVAP